MRNVVQLNLSVIRAFVYKSHNLLLKWLSLKFSKHLIN